MFSVVHADYTISRTISVVAIWYLWNTGGEDFYMDSLHNLDCRQDYVLIRYCLRTVLERQGPLSLPWFIRWLSFSILILTHFGDLVLCFLSHLHYLSKAYTSIQTCQ